MCRRAPRAPRADWQQGGRQSDRPPCTRSAARLPPPAHAFACAVCVRVSFGGKEGPMTNIQEKAGHSKEGDACCGGTRFDRRQRSCRASSTHRLVAVAVDSLLPQQHQLQLLTLYDRRGAPGRWVLPGLRVPPRGWRGRRPSRGAAGHARRVGHRGGDADVGPPRPTRCLPASLRAAASKPATSRLLAAALNVTRAGWHLCRTGSWAGCLAAAAAAARARGAGAHTQDTSEPVPVCVRCARRPAPALP